MRPAFRDGGTVTAGNASTLNDGAACLVLATQERAEALGARPLARIVSIGVAGVDPAFMGIGPVPAIRRALDAAEMQIGDLELIEINEAFAAQVLACVGELGIDEERLNVNGGAIALGHPLGCSGARLLTTLIWEMRRRGARYGVGAFCEVGCRVARQRERPPEEIAADLTERSGAVKPPITSGEPETMASSSAERRRGR